MYRHKITQDEMANEFMAIPDPMNQYYTEIYANFADCHKSRKKIEAMAIHMFKKNYPGVKPIIYETDVQDAVCFVIDTAKFSSTQNLHNLRLDAANKLYSIIVENVYAEEELYDKYIDIKRRVHQTTQEQSVRSCKNKVRDKCYYTTGNII